MAKVNAGKVTKGTSRAPNLMSPKGEPSGTANMPRVGGHTSNVTKSQGVPGGAGGKGGSGC